MCEKNKDCTFEEYEGIVDGLPVSSMLKKIVKYGIARTLSAKQKKEKPNDLGKKRGVNLIDMKGNVERVSRRAMMKEGKPPKDCPPYQILFDDLNTNLIYVQEWQSGKWINIYSCDSAEDADEYFKAMEFDWYKKHPNHKMPLEYERFLKCGK